MTVVGLSITSLEMMKLRNVIEDVILIFNPVIIMFDLKFNIVSLSYFLLPYDCMY